MNECREALVQLEHADHRIARLKAENKRMREGVEYLEAEVARLREHVAQWQQFNSATIKAWEDDADYAEEAADETQVEA